MNDGLPARKITKLACGHHMCDSCLKRQFTFSVQDPAHMPACCCTSKAIPFEYADRLFDDKFKTLYAKKFQEFLTSPEFYDVPEDEEGFKSQEQRRRQEVGSYPKAKGRRQRDYDSVEDKSSADEKARHEAGYRRRQAEDDARRKEDDEARQRAAEARKKAEERHQQEYPSVHESSADEKARYEAGYRRRSTKSRTPGMGHLRHSPIYGELNTGSGTLSADEKARHEAGNTRRRQEAGTRDSAEEARRIRSDTLEYEALRHQYKSRAQVDEAVRPPPVRASSRDRYETPHRKSKHRPRLHGERLDPKPRPSAVRPSSRGDSREAKEPPRPSGPGERRVREVRPDSVRRAADSREEDNRSFTHQYGPEDVRWGYTSQRKKDGDDEDCSKPTLGRTATYVY
jgi:hypothetical protein